MAIFSTISQYARMLKNLDQWLQTAAEHAQKKGFEPDVLVPARLAPDQFTLAQQVQSACDAAKFAAAYLSGQKAAVTSGHREDRRRAAGAGADGRRVPGRIQGVRFRRRRGASRRAGVDGGPLGERRGYLTRISVPNFYFHVTTAYAILRHNGVELGKRDFIGVGGWEEIADW